MKIVLFGGSGMVGQGVLHVCEQDPRVEKVLLVVRKPVTLPGTKHELMVRENLTHWPDAKSVFSGYDTCFFSVGSTGFGAEEAQYRATNHDLPLAIARTLLEASAVKTFLYISGAGTDARSRQMWARIKGETEQELLNLPFEKSFCFRPGYIQPLHGVRSKVGWYNAVYTTVGWMYPVVRRLVPALFTDSDELGSAMIHVAERGFPKKILETSDIHIAARK